MSAFRDILPFAVMCVGMFAALLDIQIVASSLQDIGGGLSAAQDQISWVQTAYLIAEISFLPSCRRLSEQQKAFDRGALPDHIGDIDGRFAACSIAKRNEGAAGRKRCQSPAEDFSSNGIDHDIHAVPVRDATHSSA